MEEMDGDESVTVSRLSGNEPNGGASARNRGLEESKGRYIMFLDSIVRPWLHHEWHSITWEVR